MFSASSPSVRATGGQKRLVIEAAEQRPVLCSDWYKRLCWLMLIEAEGIVHWRISNITLKMNSNLIALNNISCKAYPLSNIRSFLQGTAILTFLEEIPNLNKSWKPNFSLFFFYIRSCIQEKIKQHNLKHNKVSMASVPKLDVPYSSIMEILFREEDIWLLSCIWVGFGGYSFNAT